jgi:cell division protein FtsI/penicillin-binding protein 2
MAEEKPEQAQEKPKRGKKINKMSIDEVQKALEAVNNSQGGQASRYARALIRRRDLLKPGKN